MSIDHRFSLLDVIAAYGSEAVIARIATLHATGCHRAAYVIERELNQLNALRSERNGGPRMPVEVDAPRFGGLA